MRWRATIHCELDLEGTELDAVRTVNAHKRILQEHFDRVASTTIRADLCRAYERPLEPFGKPASQREPEHQAGRTTGRRLRSVGARGDA